MPELPHDDDDLEEEVQRMRRLFDWTLAAILALVFVVSLLLLLSSCTPDPTRSPISPLALATVTPLPTFTPRLTVTALTVAPSVTPLRTFTPHATVTWTPTARTPVFDEFVYLPVVMR